MAKKVILMKFLQEIRGFAVVTNRLAAPRAPGIFLIQLREHRTPAKFPQRPQPLAITAAWQDGAEVASPVRINHCNPA